jgi:hypothetical protein
LIRESPVGTARFHRFSTHHMSPNRPTLREDDVRYWLGLIP